MHFVCKKGYPPSCDVDVVSAKSSAVGLGSMKFGEECEGTALKTADKFLPAFLDMTCGFLHVLLTSSFADQGVRLQKLLLRGREARA